MNEIDLIPVIYRENIWKSKILKIFSYVLITLFVLTGAVYGALEYVKRETVLEINKLSELKNITAQQRDSLNVLQDEKKGLNYQWTLLNGLRTAVAAEDLFVAIDTALKGVDVWFTSMKFQRTENEIEDQDTVKTGYFIIVSPEDKKELLAIGTKLFIAGGSPNHSTLSSFVKNLLDQPEILDAKVLETLSVNYMSDKYVKFNLAITINLNSKV
jgi:hypothetical protein